MKRVLKKKVMICLMLTTMLVSLVQTITLASAEELQILKKSAKEYIIYVSGMLDQKFEFAFSNNASEAKENLVFMNSAKDSTDGDNYNNIAYIDDTSYTTYFEGKPNTYMWVKQGTTYKLEAKEIDLNTAITETEIQEINNVTKKINVTIGKMYLEPEINSDGVKITRELGTINITPTEGSEYLYKMLKAEVGTDEAQLIKLIAELNDLETSAEKMDKKLSAYNQFRKLYKQLQPEESDAGWKAVEDNTIKQDPNSKNGEQYLVWIKETTNNQSSITDIQIMTCNDNYKTEYEDKEVVIKEIVKLPVTGDDVTLLVVAGALILLIVAVVILKVVNKKSNIKE